MSRVQQANFLIRTSIFAVSLLATANVFAQTTTETGPIVSTASGKLKGELNGKLRIFRGIPFAAPPIGDLRWEPPQPAASWKDVRDATKFGADCPAPTSLLRRTAEGAGSVHGLDFDVWVSKMDAGANEDCLTLNVWAPDAATKKAPVMVFFSPSGNGSAPGLDGSSFARDGVVFVSLNNRLMTMSVFAHPALTRAAAPKRPYSRLHDLDHIAALQWVQKNIAAFGGDPGNVTLFGESNAGAAVLLLLSAPKAKGLFHKAIVQSGSSRSIPINYAGMEKIGVELATMAGLDGEKATVKQLRALPVDALPFFGANNLDENLLTQSMENAFAKGQTLDIPLMIGGNNWDASSLRYKPSLVVDRTSPEVLEAYKQEGLSGDALGSAIYNDEHVNAPARWFAAAQAARGVPTYNYIYSYVLSLQKNKPGAAHGDEIPFVFDSWNKIPFVEKAMNDTDRRVTKIMHDCWIAFARMGKPQCEGVPEWPTYNKETNFTMELNATPTLRQNYRKAQYDAQDVETTKHMQPFRDGQEVVEAIRKAK